MSLDPKFKACRDGRHTPDVSSAVLVGREVVTTCTVCGGGLSAPIGGWDAVYTDEQCCQTCGEAELWCECATFAPPTEGLDHG